MTLREATEAVRAALYSRIARNPDLGDDEFDEIIRKLKRLDKLS